ncbi:MAG: imidazole glycerol phosphate synthase subunit HisH, partial [Calditrichaeota bacterium]|nr:imidazole glycerol phosphate synthase subunit HisH [Calditrichota bacterium]
MIGIVDYGAGNLRSVKKALDFLGAESRIVAAPGEIEGIEKMILPGVGAFRAAMEKLQEKDLFRPVAQWLAADRPFLGIC